MTYHRFKGSSAYELQIGKLVFQVPYLNLACYRYSWLCRNFGLHIWIDPFG